MFAINLHPLPIGSSIYYSLCTPPIKKCRFELPEKKFSFVKKIIRKENVMSTALLFDILYWGQGVYQPGKLEKNQGISNVMVKSGNFVIGQRILMVLIVNSILQKFAILALIFMLKKKNFFARYAPNIT
jgi:hypothetical protein